MLTWNWPEFWNLFRKAHPEAKQGLGQALIDTNFDGWMQTCSDAERTQALENAPIAVTLSYIRFFRDVKKARKVSLQYSEKLHPLLESVWEDRSPENLKVCITLSQRLGG